MMRCLRTISLSERRGIDIYMPPKIKVADRDGTSCIKIACAYASKKTDISVYTSYCGGPTLGGIHSPTWFTTKC